MFELFDEKKESMDEQQKARIRKLRKPNRYGVRPTLEEIAAQYGVTRQRIQQIIGNDKYANPKTRVLELDAERIAYKLHIEHSVTREEILKRYSVSRGYLCKFIPTKSETEDKYGLRRCVICKRVKPLAEFYRLNIDRPRPLMSMCKTCSTERSTNWYKNNRERANRYHRERRKRMLA